MYCIWPCNLKNILLDWNKSESWKLISGTCELFKCFVLYSNTEIRYYSQNTNSYHVVATATGMFWYNILISTYLDTFFVLFMLFPWKVLLFPENALPKGVTQFLCIDSCTFSIDLTWQAIHTVNLTAQCCHSNCSIMYGRHHKNILLDWNQSVNWKFVYLHTF